MTLSLSLASPTINSTGGPVQLQEGANKTLECHFDGLPPPSVKWFHGAKTLVTSIISPRLSQEIVSATSYRPGIPAFAARLTITNAKHSDSGNYTCQFINRVATLQPPFSLNVLKRESVLFVVSMSDTLFPVADYCSSSPCLNGATCRNELSSFLCDCAPNWSGLMCENR